MASDHEAAQELHLPYIRNRAHGDLSIYIKYGIHNDVTGLDQVNNLSFWSGLIGACKSFLIDVCLYQHQALI
jgi:hypothetical protein